MQPPVSSGNTRTNKPVARARSLPLVFCLSSSLFHIHPCIIGDMHEPTHPEMYVKSSRHCPPDKHWPLRRVKPALQVAHVVEEPETQAWQSRTLHAGTLEG